MATQRTVVAATKAATNLTQAATKQAAPWVQNMPTRAIADALLNKENLIAPHDKLYEEVNQTGLFRSHRHFKHCLRMLKEQNRVKVISLGPEKVTSNKLKFTVKLTARGRHTYSYYREAHRRSLEAKPEDDGPGLKDALP